jgi:hypothetical protein
MRLVNASWLLGRHILSFVCSRRHPQVGLKLTQALSACFMWSAWAAVVLVAVVGALRQALRGAVVGAVEAQNAQLVILMPLIFLRL